MKYCKLSRRHFLQGTGGFAMALPFLPSLVAGKALAEVPANGKFFIHLSTEHGALHPLSWGPDVSNVQWTPSEQELLYPGTPMLGTEHWMRHKPLAQLMTNGRLSPVFDEQFTPLLPKMNLIDGLALMFGGSHHSGGYLGNFHGNMNRDFRTGRDANLNSDPVPTIDQVMAQSTSFYSANDPRTMPVLNMGDGQPQSFRPRNGIIQPVSYSWSLNDIYDYMFGGGGGSQASPQRISALNRVYEDYQRLVSPAGGGARLSSEDATAVEQHMDSLNEIERRIENIGQVASCNTTGIGGQHYGPNDPQSEQNVFHQPNRASYAQYWSTYVDLMVTAINCGLCRVFTISLGVPVDLSGDTYHSNVAHQYDQPGSQPIIEDAHHYAARYFILPLLQRLNDVQILNGQRLLDNGLVVWQHESWWVPHEGKAIPTMTAGGANGALRTGHYVDFRNLNNRGLQRNAYNGSTQQFDPNNPYSTLYPGLPMNRWLHTVLSAMGVGRAEYLALSGIPSGSTMHGYGDTTVQPGYTGLTFDNTIGNVTQRVTHEAFPQRIIDDCNTPLPFLAV